MILDLKMLFSEVSFRSIFHLFILVCIYKLLNIVGMRSSEDGTILDD